MTQSRYDGRTSRERVIARFLAAASTDPAAACALLTPRTRTDLEASEGAKCAPYLCVLGS